MSVSTFIPKVWSARLQENLHRQLVFGSLCNRSYEGEISKYGDTVHINALTDVTVRAYSPGSDLAAPEALSGTDTEAIKSATEELTQSFYKVMAHMGVKTVYNHADFRLMSCRALREFSNYHEYNLFLRGIVPLIGYRTDCVYYDRKERAAGVSKYPLK